MRNSTNYAPPPKYHDYSCTCSQNWASPPSCLTSRGTARPKPHHRLNSFNLTKACPLRPNSSTSTLKLDTPYHLRSYIHAYWRLRRIKSNTTSQDSCIFINCPLRLNNPCPTILPLHHPTHPSNLFHYDNLNISCV